MIKKIGIISSIIAVLVLTAFLIAPKSGSVQAKKFYGDLSLSVLEVSKDDYAELNNSVSSAYEDDLIYLFRIENSNNSSPLLFNLESKEQYGERINYFSEQIKDDLSVVQGLDTVPCSFVHWERSFTSKPVITVTTIFKSKNSNTPTKFEWRDNVYSGIPQRLKLH